MIHSSKHKNGKLFQNQGVLVVRFGNSGGEIAIDLSEHGAKLSISVRSPVNVIPRDVLGIPILAMSIPLNKIPARLADALSAPLLRLLIGDLTHVELHKLPYGPITQIKRDRKVPLIDVGTITLIKRGYIKVYAGIERFTSDGVVFVDGEQKKFDSVILATGYRAHVDSFLKDASLVTDADGNPLSSGQETSVPGLYFCGFYVAPTGMLREIAIEAKRISRDIKRNHQKQRNAK
jgi:cation diffusion facilitator CzcD-associated flavoprotein CzcO